MGCFVGAGAIANPAERVRLVVTLHERLRRARALGRIFQVLITTPDPTLTLLVAQRCGSRGAEQLQRLPTR
jgi:hypothetical protein